MDIITKLAKEAIRNLALIKAEYIVKMPDGEIISHGSLELKPVKTGRAPRTDRTVNPAHKGMGAYIDTIVGWGAAQVGDVFVIPVSTFPYEAMQGSVASRACMKWGKGTFRTCLANHNTEVQLMKVA